MGFFVEFELLDHLELIGFARVAALVVCGNCRRRHNVFGTKGLELDRVRTRCARRFDQAKGQVQAAVVVHTGFRDHKYSIRVHKLDGCCLRYSHWAHSKSSWSSMSTDRSRGITLGSMETLQKPSRAALASAVRFHT